LINNEIEGYNVYSSTNTNDLHVLALITPATYEDSVGKVGGFHSMMKVTFYLPPVNQNHATGFYLVDEDRADEVLIEAQLARATNEGDAYVFRGYEPVKGLVN
jgi:hypothetical protein